jgi:hypothetical protein
MGQHHFLAGADVALLAYVVFVGVGLLNCFFGYRLFRVLLGIWGFVGGAALSMTLLQGASVDPLVQIVGALLGGIAGAVLVSALYLVGGFLFGASFGLLMASVLQQHLHALPLWPLTIALAVIGGIAALALQRPLITLFTAFGGAWVVVAGVASAIADCPLKTFPAHCVRASPWALVILVAWLVLGFCGLATQSQLGGGRGRRRHDED